MITPGDFDKLYVRRQDYDALVAQLAEYRGVDKTDHRYQPCVNLIERLEAEQAALLTQAMALREALELFRGYCDAEFAPYPMENSAVVIAAFDDFIKERK